MIYICFKCGRTRGMDTQEPVAAIIHVLCPLCADLLREEMGLTADPRRVDDDRR